jgi:DNA-binding transcriptional regulator WhiA
MARKWTRDEKKFYRFQLIKLYIEENKTINEIGLILDISPSGVFDRLKRLNIPTIPQNKEKYRNQRSDIIIPNHSNDLAEFIGIMLGDGHLSHFQTTVTLGSKEISYAQYVGELMKYLFGSMAHISLQNKEYRIVYIGSTQITDWLQVEGLVFNKVKSQVDVPNWIFEKDTYMERFIRGFFDTDGSVYELKYGIQISFTNRSRPLLRSLQQILLALNYNVSAISGYQLYITQIDDIRRFFREIAPKNLKHVERFKTFITRYDNIRTGSPVGCGG